MSKKKVIIFGSLSDKKFLSKTIPIIKSKEVDKIFLFRFNGFPFYSDKVKTFKGIINKYLFWIYFFVSSLMLIIFNKIDFLIGIYYFPYGFIINLLGKLTNRNTILLLTGSDLKILLKNTYFIKFLNYSEYIGVRGTKSKEKLIKYGINENKLFISHNVFETIIFDSSKENKIYDLIYIGELSTKKNILILPEIVKLLVNIYPKIRCVVLGEGKEREKLNQKITDLDLSKNIQLVGYKKQVNDYLIKSKVLVLPSISEGLPMVLIESMSKGVPVVSSNVDDISDLIIDNQNGVLIEEIYNPIKYFEKINQILDDEEFYQKLSKNSLTTIAENLSKHYSAEVISEEWNRIFEKQK